MNISKEIDEIDKKSPDYSDHCRTFREILQTTLWVFVPAPEFLLKGAIESADFWALKFQKKKNLDHNDWYKLFQISIRSLEKFIMDSYSTGLTFNFHGEDKWNLLIDGTTTSASSSEAPKPVVKETSAPVVPAKKQKKKEMIGQTCTLSYF